MRPRPVLLKFSTTSPAPTHSPLTSLESALPQVLILNNLKSFRINTYAKPIGGPPLPIRHSLDVAPRQTPRIQSIASLIDQKERRAPMPEIQLHNTLSGKVEPFVPQKPGEVRMYTCGPTVYDYAHIGNYRTFVFQDVLRRFLKLRGFQMKHVMNLTDVDDRIIGNAAAAGKSIREYTEKFVQAFFDDCKTLSIEAPEHWIRATDHIDDMVQLIQKLRDK